MHLPLLFQGYLPRLFMGACTRFVPGHASVVVKRLQKVANERCLYRDIGSGMYYIRIYANGGDTYRSLETTRVREARQRLDIRRAAKAAAKLGLALEPDAAARQVTVYDVIETYEAAGFPDKRGRARENSSAEKKNCETLKAYYVNGFLIDDLSQKALDEYHEWRTGVARKGAGHRMTDLELNTLSNALRWAVRKEMIEENPISSRCNYHSSRESRHCREVCPADTIELHKVARILFGKRRSEVLGWQMLFEAFTGQRSCEAVVLQLNAGPDEPGYISPDGKSLRIHRSKAPRVINPFVHVHGGVQQLLAAHKRWHRHRFPESPWLLPGRSKIQHVTPSALTQSLDRHWRGGEIPRKYTSHGMRAFYVLVRRSHGIPDSQIAHEINHSSGTATLEQVYGAVPPHWLAGQAPRVEWIPEMGPAWDVFDWSNETAE